MRPKPAKFQWPPNTALDEPRASASGIESPVNGASGVEPHSLTLGVRESHSLTLGAGEPVARPPGSESHPLTLGARLPLATARGSESHPLTLGARFGSVLADIERTWFSRVVDPLPERLSAAGWSADGPLAYCPRCASSVGPHEADDTGCSWCRGRRLRWERAVRLSEYRGVLRRTILEVKFTRWRRVGDDLGRMLGRALAERLDTAATPIERVVIVPVPTSLRSRVARGIDHALVIARGVSAATGCPIARVLSRRHRPTQRSVSRAQRARNVAGSFTYSGEPGELAGRLVVLVDDVRTTGATLSAACRVIRRHHPDAADQPSFPRIWTAVLGVTPEPGRRNLGRSALRADGYVGRLSEPTGM